MNLTNKTCIYFIMIFMSTNCFDLIPHSNFILLLYYFYNFLIARKKIPYYKIVVFILFGLILSIWSCKTYRGQSVLDSFQVLSPFWTILSFFYFYRERHHIKEMEKALFIFFVFFSICYLFTVFFPNTIFPYKIDTNNSNYKILFPGLGILPFAYFYLLNKYFFYGRKKYLILFALSIVLLIMRTSRLQLFIFIPTIIIFISLYFKNKLGKLIYVLLSMCIFSMIISQTQFFLGIYGTLISKQNLETFSNSNYIRLISLDYFNNNFFHDIIERICGAGIPANNTVYGKYMNDFHYTGIRTGWLDWGLLGYSWVLGIITTLGFLIYLLIPIFRKYPKEYYYIPFFFIYLLEISILAITIFMQGSIIIETMLIIISIQVSKPIFKR